MEPIIADNLQCIEQAIALLDVIETEVYSKASSMTLGAGIGGHIRHNIDHYESFLSRPHPTRIDYEARSRDPILEIDPAAAAERLRAICAALRSIDTTQLDSTIEVKIENPGNAPESQWACTTDRRELQFLLSHTVHHYALIAMICHHLGHPTPEDFGVAPSTLRHRQLLQCAQ